MLLDTLEENRWPEPREQEVRKKKKMEDTIWGNRRNKRTVEAILCHKEKDKKKKKREDSLPRLFAEEMVI